MLLLDVDIMLVFKKLCDTQRRNSFKALYIDFEAPANDDEITGSVWKQTPVKRKISNSESEHFMDDKDYSPLPTKIRTLSEDNDGSEIESDGNEDPPNRFLEEDSKVESSNTRSSNTGCYSENIHTENCLNPGGKTSPDPTKS